MYGMNYFIGENQWPTLVRHLYPVYFPNMIELKIQGNQIESVEGLINISMPNLQKLYISTHYIRQIKTILSPSECSGRQVGIYRDLQLVDAH